MKAKKIIRGTLLILITLILLLLCVFLFWLGPTVKLVAQNIGSKALGTPLTIRELTINPRHGTFHMTGFAIANHDDFGHSNAVSLASMDIALDIGSLFSPTIVVHRVAIDSPHFVYEQNAAEDNINRFVRNMEEYLGIDPNTPPPAKPEKEMHTDDHKAPKIVVVENLEIRDIQFHLANTVDPQLDIAVSLDKLALSMTNGVIGLRHLQIGNPGRLETPNLFTLDEISIEVELASIYSGTLSLRDVEVIRPYAYLEKNPDTDTVAEFMKIADEFIRTTTNSIAEPSPAASGDPEPEPAARPVPVQLHHLMVDDIRVKLIDSTTTNVPVNERMLAGIGSISVRLVEGMIRITGISIPNPPGYQAENLFYLSTIDISIDPASFFSDQIVVEKILLNSSEINLEQTETSGNGADLQAELMAFVPPARADVAAPLPEEEPADEESPQPVPLAEQPVVLHSLEVSDFVITLALPQTTNGSHTVRESLSNLNPMDGTALAKFNPLAKRDSAKATNVIDNAAAPLKLIIFDQLLAQPLEGRLAIDNLSVANTHGFANEHLVTIGQFIIDLDPDTLQSDLLIIEDILIEKPRVYYERQITTDNIKALQAAIGQAVSRHQDYAPHMEPAEQPVEQVATEPESAQKVMINHLLVQGGLVRAKLSALPSAPIPLPNIEIKDLGKDEGGTSIGQAAAKIGGTFYDSILKSISGTTGFTMDALKGVGTLTLDSLGKAGGKSFGQTAEETPHRADTPPSAASQDSPAKKRRSPLHRRRPGRIF